MSKTIKLVRTCDSCPEQYDAYLGDEKVGYLRLRHGHFRVECPDSGGDWVYRAYPQGDGAFEETERDYHLTQAVHSIRLWLSQRDGASALYEVVSGSESPLSIS